MISVLFKLAVIALCFKYGRIAFKTPPHLTDSSIQNRCFSLKCWISCFEAPSSVILQVLRYFCILQMVTKALYTRTYSACRYYWHATRKLSIHDEQELKI